MSPGARNWPFLMFTGLPQAATAWMKSVCRQRKAGVCSTSTTAATARLRVLVHVGQHRHADLRRTSARICRPASTPGPRADLPELRLALS
jgi:hypothetical protein